MPTSNKGLMRDPSPAWADPANPRAVELQQALKAWNRNLPEGKRLQVRALGDARFMALVDEVEGRFRTGDPRIYALFDRIRELHVTKGNDYADNADHFRNVRQAQDFGVAPWVGAMLRGNDKMERVKNFAAGTTLNHESVANSMFDLAAYCFIALALYFDENGITEGADILASL